MDGERLMKCKICRKESDMPFHTCKRPAVGMTLDEMKLVVCEKLTELVHVHGVYALDGKQHPYWRSNGAIIHWPTEGLQVCHEAEKLIADSHVIVRYWTVLHGISDRSFYESLCFATYEQRLEALCRVWFPERFK